MAFDVGGFLGGLIGAAGAYGAAWLTIQAERKKEMPKIISQSYETAVEMQLKIASLHVVLQTLPESTLFEVIEAMQSFSKVFGPILSKAIENNEELARIGFKVYENMNEALEKPFSSGNALTWKKKETKNDAVAIIERFDKAILQALIDIRKVIDDIHLQYTEEQ